MKKSLKPKTKVKVKKLVLPVISSCFLFAMIISITLTGSLVPLMGNSITNKYVCSEGYKLVGSNCLTSMDARKLGDINNDGAIDNEDIVILQEYINNSEVLNETLLSVADVTFDGKIDINDVNKMKFYLGGIVDISEYICPSGYELNGNTCTLSYSATIVSNSLDDSTAVYYNDSYWYVLSNNDDYVTLLKKDTLDDISYYNNINNILNNYITDIADDLKEVNGSKIRLLTIEELKKLGFVDKSNTNYYESSDDAFKWIGIIDKDYWVANNSSFILTNYEGNNYAYNMNDNILAYIRPVINVYKKAIIK